MTRDFRMSRQTVSVMESLLADPNAWRYGYDISRETGLKSGTLYYPILMRLTANSFVETRWEESEPGRPPRHMYRLTPTGRQEAQRFLARAEERGFLPAHIPERGQA